MRRVIEPPIGLTKRFLGQHIARRLGNRKPVRMIARRLFQTGYYNVVQPLVWRAEKLPVVRSGMAGPRRLLRSFSRAPEISSDALAPLSAHTPYESPVETGVVTELESQSPTVRERGTSVADRVASRAMKRPPADLREKPARMAPSHPETATRVPSSRPALRATIDEEITQTAGEPVTRMIHPDVDDEAAEPRSTSLADEREMPSLPRSTIDEIGAAVPAARTHEPGQRTARPQLQAEPTPREIVPPAETIQPTDLERVQRTDAKSMPLTRELHRETSDDPVSAETPPRLQSSEPVSVEEKVAPQARVAQVTEPTSPDSDLVESQTTKTPIPPDQGLHQPASDGALGDNELTETIGESDVQPGPSVAEPLTVFSKPLVRPMIQPAKPPMVAQDRGAQIASSLVARRPASRGEPALPLATTPLKAQRGLSQQRQTTSLSRPGSRDVALMPYQSAEPRSHALASTETVTLQWPPTVDADDLVTSSPATIRDESAMAGLARPIGHEMPLAVSPPPSPGGEATDLGLMARFEPGLPTVSRFAGTTVIQRSQEQRESEPAATTSAANAGPTRSQSDAEDDAPSVDLDSMARQVYQILRRRLRVEQERAGAGYR